MVLLPWGLGGPSCHSKQEPWGWEFCLLSIDLGQNRAVLASVSANKDSFSGDSAI